MFENTTTRQFKKRMAITCVIAPMTLLLHSVIMPTSATAARIGNTGNTGNEIQCVPLSIVSIIPKSPRVIVENGKNVGVNVQFVTTVKNTSRTKTFFDDIPVTLGIISTSLSPKTVPDGGRDKYTVNKILRPNASISFSSKRVNIRKQSNRYNLIANLAGFVHNEHCQDQGRPHYIGTSNFVYDLTPMMTGRPPIRKSGHIQGPSGHVRPPIRPTGVSGAPRPRGRT